MQERDSQSELEAWFVPARNRQRLERLKQAWHGAEVRWSLAYWLLRHAERKER